MVDSADHSPSIPSLPERYFTLITEIVGMTLKGNIRSKEQVYQLLTEGIEPGTGEIFERCLSDRLSTSQHEVDTQRDEFKQAKATRTLRALKTIESEWQRWQTQNQAAAALTIAVQQIVTADPEERLSAFLGVADPNREPILSLQQWQGLVKQLQQQAALRQDAELQELTQGITQGLAAWEGLSDHLVSWLYDQSQGQLGFGGVPGQRGPWATWAKHLRNPTLQQLFQQLSLEQPIGEWMRQHREFSLADWVELTLILQGLYQGLINWFDRLVYDAQVGAKLSIATYLTFAALWSQLADAFAQLTVGLTANSAFVDGAFQATLQILRDFAQRDYFPLYGGIFASFSGRYLRNALDYLDQPLRRSEGTQEKARILTLLGYSYRAQGDVARSIAFHQQALEIAREAGDRLCEIANLNHLSRTGLAQKKYSEAISYSQHALILSRQTGDRLGEANALANYGYSEVLQAQQIEQGNQEVYELAIERLREGLELTERLGDRQSQALCYCSLGIALVMLEQAQPALTYLESGLQAAQFSGDLYLQALNFVYLAEANYQLQQREPAAIAACLGRYLLEQIGANIWPQPGSLLMILRGQMGDEFKATLEQHRPQIIRLIGVDGYDYLLQKCDSDD